LTTLYVSHNPMSAAARKVIEVEFVLCQMRNPTVTRVIAPSKRDFAKIESFDDQDAIKIGEGLRYVFHLMVFCTKKKLLAPPDCLC
jgi:hypothetical protein